VVVFFSEQLVGLTNNKLQNGKKQCFSCNIFLILLQNEGNVNLCSLWQVGYNCIVLCTSQKNKHVV